MEGGAGGNASSEGLACIAHAAKQETKKIYENTSFNRTGDKRTDLGFWSVL
jgi:hypothetical protein